MSVMPEPGAHPCHTVEKGLSTSGNPVQPAENEDLASRATERRSLKRKAFLGLSWQTTNTVSRQVLTFATGIVLARMLTPSEFGLVNLAVIATTWVGILGGLGVETSLIQRSTLLAEEIDASFWIAAGVGFLSAGVLILVSPLLGRFYNSPLLTDMLLVYSLSLFLGGLNIVPASLLRRSLDFKGVAKVEVLGTLTSGCVAIVLVLLGVGAMSIPWGGAAGLLVSMIVYRRLGIWTIRPFPTRSLMAKVARFSSFLAGSRALVLMRIYIDNALVGKFLGAQNLGYYSLGYNLVSVPEYRIVGLVTSIAFPALSTLRKEPHDIGRAYLRILKYTAAVVMPLLVGLMLLADKLIPLVYGPNWIPAVPAIQILCFAGLGTAFVAITDSPLLALGKNRTLFYLNLLWVVMLGGAVLVTLAVSPTLTGIAYVVAAAAAVMACAMNIIVARSCHLSARQVISALLASLLSTVSMTGAIVALEALGISSGSGWVQTVILLLGGAATYIFVALFFFQELRSGLLQGIALLVSIVRARGTSTHEQ